MVFHATFNNIVAVSFIGGGNRLETAILFNESDIHLFIYNTSILLDFYDSFLTLYLKCLPIS
jgi:hypothetical protein